jgi:ubiquinone biosynthesis protein
MAALTIDGWTAWKISRRGLLARGHDLNAIAERLVISFLTQAISAGFSTPTCIKAILFIEDDGLTVAIDFRDRGPDRSARRGNG